MRNLDRDKQWVLVSRFEKIIAVEDEAGHLTGEHKIERSRQIPLLATVSANKGEAEAAAFGQSLDYDRTVLIDDPSYPISETAVLWIDKGVQKSLLDGGYFDQYSVWETGDDIDGGGFEDEAEDDVDNGGFEYPEWIKEPYDYIVKKVARSPNFTLVAVKRVEVSA